MKPWDIIGWAIISLTLFVIANVLTRIFCGWAVHHIKHLRTRNTPVEEDQTWVFPDGSEIWVEKVHDGHYSIGSGCRAYGGTRASWGIDKDEWPDYVRERKLYLEHEGS